MLCDGLFDEGVVAVVGCLQEHATSEANALHVSLEYREICRDGREGARCVLLLGRPSRLSGDFRSRGERRRPFHSEEVVVAHRELAHGISLARLADDLRDGASRRVTELLLATNGLLHHLVGDIGRKPFHGALLVLRVPEPEQGRYYLADDERH